MNQSERLNVHELLPLADMESNYQGRMHPKLEIAWGRNPGARTPRFLFSIRDVLVFGHPLAQTVRWRGPLALENANYPIFFNYPWIITPCGRWPYPPLDSDLRSAPAIIPSWPGNLASNHPVCNCRVQHAEVAVRTRESHLIQ